MMQKTSLNAFLTDSEALKSLVIMIIIGAMMLMDKVSAEIGIAALMGQGSIYGGIRQWGKNARLHTDATKAEAQADAAEALAKLKTGEM